MGVPITVIRSILWDNHNFLQLILLDNRNDPFRLLDNPNNLTMIRIRIRNIYLRSDTNLTGNTSRELLRERPFDFQGGGGFEKNILALIFAKKNILASTQKK